MGVGVFDRNARVGGGSPAPAASVRLALRVDPGGRVSGRAFLRRTLVADGDYETLMGEPLRFWSAGLELQVRVGGT